MTRQFPSRTGRAAVLATGLAALAASALAGCGDDGPAAGAAAAPTTGAPATADGDSAAPTTPAAPTASPKATKKAGGSTGHTAPTIGGGLPTGPSVVYFRVRTKPLCPSADDPDGRPVTVEWKVANVSTVTIAIDGPGIYDSYTAAKGTATFNFPCSGAMGATQKHTYLLATAGETARRTKQITVAATVRKG